MRGLEGKRIVVAGAATGIGAATARRLAEEGAKVIAGDINEPELEKTVSNIAQSGGTIEPRRFDLTDAAACEDLIRACVDTHGGIDGLANIAADTSPHLLAADLDVLSISEDIWRHHYDANMLGFVRTIRAALPYLVAQKAGAIVNISSASAHIGEPLRPSYASSKIAINTLTRHVAMRWGPDNIRCNSIAPGPVLTEKFEALTPSEVIQEMCDKMPLHRAGKPSDIAGAIAFLLSDDGNWVTGQVWSVNGGWTLRE